MTPERAARMATVTALRAQGLTWQQVGDRLGLSPQGANDIIRALGHCIECGSPTFYRGAKRCGPCGRAAQTASDIAGAKERFLQRIDRRGPDECWPWTGPSTPFGYGNATVANGRLFRTAHRGAWLLLVGPIPDGLFVLHKCDNPPCCNPAHLYLGTSRDNSRDMVEHGRSLVGHRNPNAKLTQADVLVIRRRLALGEPHRPIAESFGVSPSAVRGIKRGLSWAWLTSETAA